MEAPQHPPTPRLFPGQVLSENIEIGALFYADNRKNLYEVQVDGQPLTLLECHADLKLKTVSDSVQPFTPFCHDAFTYKNRHYILYGDMPGTLYDSWQPITREEEITHLIYDVLTMVDAIHFADMDLAQVHLQDCYFDIDGVGCLLLPAKIHSQSPSRETWMRQFIRDLCYRKLERKTTRNLKRPLACLHFSGNFETALQAFIDGTTDLNSFRQAIHIRVQAPSLDPDIAGLTNVGMVRDHNEDAFATFSYTASNYQGRADQHFLAVSDGMGGHARGEVASQKALDHWQRLFLARTLLTDAPECNPLWVKTTRDIYELVASRLDSDKDLKNGVAPMSNPGATLVSATISSRLAFIGNAGDSRAYLISGNTALRLSRDHSLVQLYVDRGQITPEEAHGHEHSNVITSYMGIELKMFRQHTSVCWIPPGARLLLCSDGLTDMLDEIEIAAIASQDKTATQIVAELVEAANDAGGNDNITVLMLKDRAPAEYEHDGEITLDLDLETDPQEEQPESQEEEPGVQNV